MARKATLTTEQAAAITEYRAAFDGTVQAEISVWEAWRATYLAAYAVTDSGLSLRAGAKECGVSHGTFAKHVMAHGFRNASHAAWTVVTDDSRVLPHVIVGRAIDAGVPADMIRGILEGFSSEAESTVDTADEATSLSMEVVNLTGTLKAIDSAIRAAKKRNDDNADTDTPDDDADTDTPDDDADTDTPDDSDKSDRDLMASRALLAGVVKRTREGNPPSLAELQAYFDMVGQLSAALKELPGVQAV